MSPVSQVFHTQVTVSIGLKTSFRVETSIPQILMSIIVGRALNMTLVVLFTTTIPLHVYKI